MSQRTRYLIPLAAVLVLAAGLLAWRPWRRPAPAQTAPVDLRLYFHVQKNPEGEPVAVTRRLELPAAAGSRGRAAAAIRALLSGPTPAEQARGLYTSLPKEARLLKIVISRPLAFLNFSRKLEAIGGSTRVKAALEELAYTVAALPGLKGVVLEIEGERAGTEYHPFTGEGLLFDTVHPRVDGSWAKGLRAPEALDLFVTVIPAAQGMWRLMGPRARARYGSPAGIDTAAFAEGLGSWRNYRVVGQQALGEAEMLVEIAGRQTLEGNVEPNARYTAHMVREQGQWKWELPLDD